MAEELLLARTELRGCPVTGCQLETLAMVICPAHYELLPQRFKDPLWGEYSAGYHKGAHPTNGFRQALAAAVAWLEENTELQRD